MSDMITISKSELDQLQERAKKLAREKSSIQLIIHLMEKLGVAPGLENTIETMLMIVLNCIGGTNIVLYYFIDHDIYYADVYGKKMKINNIDDNLIQKVLETREVIEYEHDFKDTMMITPEFTKATTWVFPLVVGHDLVGVFKMENLHIGMHDFRQQLPTFFNYAALILKNEIQGYTKLKKANDLLEKEVLVRKKTEEDLRKAKDGLEKKVVERTADIVDANKKLEIEIEERKITEGILKSTVNEKELLLKELYHRTKNNMEVICGILNLQSVFSKDTILSETVKICNDRIKSMAMVHEKLYQSKDLSNISLKSYLNDLIEHLKESYLSSRENISLILDVIDKSVSIETAIPFGLIINELITNSLKHAFPGEKGGEIKIKISSLNKDEMELSVTDNGIGLPVDFNFEKASSLGVFLVKNIVESQLHGMIELKKGCGTEYLIRVKELKYKKRI